MCAEESCTRRPRGLSTPQARHLPFSTAARIVPGLVDSRLTVMVSLFESLNSWNKRSVPMNWRRENPAASQVRCGRSAAFGAKYAFFTRLCRRMHQLFRFRIHQRTYINCCSAVQSQIAHNCVDCALVCGFCAPALFNRTSSPLAAPSTITPQKKGSTASACTSVDAPVASVSMPPCVSAAADDGPALALKPLPPAAAPAVPFADGVAGCAVAC